MALSRLRKLIIILLTLYWPALFILAHIPIPKLIRKAGMSDKGLHFLAYMVLSFLLWSAISPYKKVIWRKATVWWVLLVIVWYGVIDELLQGCIAGRSCDIRDFFADLAGTFTGLILLSLFTFLPAFLVVTGVVIFGLTNISRVSLADLLPWTNTLFHLFTYALFTLLWIRYLDYSLSLKAPKLKWLITAFILPAAFLLAVKLGSLILGRSFVITDVVTSAIGIVVVICLIFLTALLRQRPSLLPPDY